MGSLFKKSLYAIFVCETNPDPPAITIASREILFLLVSLFYPGAERGRSSSFIKKIVDSDLLKKFRRVQESFDPGVFQKLP